MDGRTQPAGPEVKVLYVLGVYRSGTTVLSSLLGQLDGFFNVGELRTLWRELTSEHGVCGCGEPLRACEVWAEILRQAIGDEQAVLSTSTAMWAWQRSALREAHTWGMTLPLLAGGRRELTRDAPVSRYAAGLSRMYTAIRDVSEARVIVDSSKEPTDAALIRRLPHVRPYFVQIVRDPRGTVYSGFRHEGRGGPDWRRSAYGALSWAAGNLAGAGVRLAHGSARSMLLRYEDFVADPRQAAARIAALVEEPAELGVAGDRHTVRVEPTHSVCGNANRFRTGDVTFRQDLDWVADLHRVDRQVVTALCAPLLARYHYRVFR